MVKYIIFLLLLYPSFIKGQYITSSDIDTSNKSEIEICEQINIKLDSILNRYPTDSNVIINKGFILPSIALTKQEKKKGCLIYIDSLGLIPDSLKHLDIFVNIWIDPYCKIICFNILKTTPCIQIDFELLKHELDSFLEEKITDTGYWSDNNKTAIYSEMTLKIRIERLHKFLR